MQVAIAKIIEGRASIHAGGGAGGGAAERALFCGLIRADGERHCWPGASSDPSPKGLGNVFGIGDKRPITVNSMAVDADLVTEV